MKEFLPYDSVRIDALKLAHKIYQQDKFVPDVIYTSLRGGAYMANVISEYYKVALKNHKPVLYAAVVARSYTDVSQHSAVRIDGWTYSPDYLRAGDKIMLVDDIFDSGRTLNYLVGILLERGVPRENIKIVVHDYKVYKWKGSFLFSLTIGAENLKFQIQKKTIGLTITATNLSGLHMKSLRKIFISLTLICVRF